MSDNCVLADLVGPRPEPATRPAHFGAYLHRLNAGQDLAYEEARSYMRMVLGIDDGRQRSAQLGVLLNGFMAKRPTVEEATGVIDAALELDAHHPSRRPAHPFTGERVVGMAGSGKKGVKTPNISTRSHRALADLVAVNAATLIFLGTSQHTRPKALALTGT